MARFRRAAAIYRDYMKPFAKGRGPSLDVRKPMSILREAHCRVIVDFSTCGGVFTESIVRRYVMNDRPIIFALSNPNFCTPNACGTGLRVDRRPGALLLSSPFESSPGNRKTLCRARATTTSSSRGRAWLGDFPLWLHRDHLKSCFASHRSRIV